MAKKPTKKPPKRWTICDCGMIVYATTTTRGIEVCKCCGAMLVPVIKERSKR